jgi:hypothetical protein
LSREERVGYMDEADRFYADPEGFIIRMLSKLPQRLVFFGSLRPNLDIIQDKYREVMTSLGVGNNLMIVCEIFQFEGS